MLFHYFRECRIRVKTSQAVRFVAFARQLFQGFFVRDKVCHFCESGGKITQNLSGRLIRISRALLLRFCGQAISTGAPPRGPSPDRLCGTKTLRRARLALQDESPAVASSQAIRTRLPARQRSAALVHQLFYGAEAILMGVIVQKVERCILHIWGFLCSL